MLLLQLVAIVRCPGSDIHGHGDTDYVLANPGHSFVAYASGPTVTIGLKNMTSGTYSFKWFDCKDGNTVQQETNAKS